MTNPFQFGGVVSGDAFCNREKEQADLLRAMENSEKMFVFSERRYGKTSLVRAVLRRLRRNAMSVPMWICGPRRARQRLSRPLPRLSRSP